MSRALESMRKMSVVKKTEFLQKLGSGYKNLDDVLLDYGYTREDLGELLKDPNVRGAMEEQAAIQLQAGARILLASVPMASLQLANIIMNGSDKDKLNAIKTLFRTKQVGFLNSGQSGTVNFYQNMTNMSAEETKKQLGDLKEDPENYEEFVEADFEEV